MYCNRPCLFVCLCICESALLQPARSVCVTSECFFIFICVVIMDMHLSYRISACALGTWCCCFSMAALHMPSNFAVPDKPTVLIFYIVKTIAKLHWFQCHWVSMAGLNTHSWRLLTIQYNTIQYNELMLMFTPSYSRLSWRPPRWMMNSLVLSWLKKLAPDRRLII